MKIPKKTKNKKYHRLKRQSVKYSFKKQSLAYGYWGLKSLQSGRITEKQIEAVRQSIMKKIRPSGKLWIRIFPDIPITSKPVGVRMGKGKGSVDYWTYSVAPGEILYEVNGVTSSVAMAALKLGSKKLPIRTKVVSY